MAPLPIPTPRRARTAPPTAPALRRWAAAHGLPVTMRLDAMLAAWRREHAAQYNREWWRRMTPAQRAARLEQIARGKATARAARLATAPKLVCARCGADFVPRRSDQLYCHHRCKRQVDNARQRVRLRAAAAAARGARACPVCGRVFAPRSRAHVCCSPACRRRRVVVGRREDP